MEKENVVGLVKDLEITLYKLKRELGMNVAEYAIQREPTLDEKIEAIKKLIIENIHKIHESSEDQAKDLLKNYHSVSKERHYKELYDFYIDCII